MKSKHIISPQMKFMIYKNDFSINFVKYILGPI